MTDGLVLLNDFNLLTNGSNPVARDIADYLPGVSLLTIEKLWYQAPFDRYTFIQSLSTNKYQQVLLYADYCWDVIDRANSVRFQLQFLVDSGVYSSMREIGRLFHSYGLYPTENGLPMLFKSNILNSIWEYNYADYLNIKFSLVAPDTGTLPKLITAFDTFVELEFDELRIPEDLYLHYKQTTVLSSDIGR